MEKVQGTLSQGSLPAVLKDIYVGQRTGVLRFQSGEECIDVSFRAGQLARVASNASEDGLGKARGILTRLFGWDEASYVFEDHSRLAEPDVAPGLSTGEIILEAVGHISDPDVVRYALGDLGRVLVHSADPLLRSQQITLSPTDGFILSRVDGCLTAREIEGVSPLSSDETLRSLFGLLSTGMIEFQAESARPQKPPVPVPPAMAPEGSPTTVPGAEPAGPSVPGSRPAGPSVPGAEPAGTTAQELRQEVLEAHERLRTANHFEMLGLPRASSEAEVKAAYFGLARRYHPDAHHDPSLADLRDKLEAVFIRIGTAYEVLRNPRSRADYEERLSRMSPRATVTAGGAVPTSDRTLPREEARQPPPRIDPAEAVEQALHEARGHIEKEKYWDAIQALEGVLPRAEGRAHVRVRLLLSKALLKNPHWVKRGEAMLREVVREDPKNSEAFFLLAHIYKESGLRSRAVSMYRKVLELQPDHPEAGAALAEFGPAEEPEPQAGGLLKKLFGRQ